MRAPDPASVPARRALASLIEDKRVIVCVGSGGVGKTTTAATLGLYGASVGKRTLVITIDPARRLANALGLSTLSHAPQQIDPALLASAGFPGAAPLSAMMLDLKSAWDDMLFRTAPDRETAERILQNRFYTALSRDLPGAHEFIACEALQHLAAAGGYDLVVLDTPPTSNALDFLEAPARILSVLDNEAFRFFAAKSDGVAAKLGLRFLDSAAHRAQSVLARFTGEQMLEELGDFIVLLRDLYGPLTTRTRAFEELLRSSVTRFLIVTSPEPAALSEAGFFFDELSARQLPLGAVIVNRVTQSSDAALEALRHPTWEAELQARGLDVDESARLVHALDEAVRQQDLLAQLDARATAQLGQRLHGRIPLVRAPRLDGAIHDLRGLGSLMPWLVGDPLDEASRN